MFFIRKSFLSVTLLFVFVAFGFTQAQAKDEAAAQATSIKIAVIDVEKVLNESKAGKSIQAQLKKRRESFQKEFFKRENDLAKAQKTLVKQKKNLSPKEFTKKRKEFEKKLLDAKTLFGKSRNSLEKELGSALSTLRKNIIQATAKVADENKFDIVLKRESVVIAEQSMDITDKVLTRLNKKVSNIKLKTPKK